MRILSFLFFILLLIAGIGSLFFAFYNFAVVATVSSEKVETNGNISLFRENVSCGHKSYSRNCYYARYTYTDQNSVIHSGSTTIGDYTALLNNNRNIRITYSKNYPQLHAVNGYLERNLLIGFLSFVSGIVFMIGVYQMLPLSVKKKLKKLKLY